MSEKKRIRTAATPTWWARGGRERGTEAEYIGRRHTRSVSFQTTKVFEAYRWQDGAKTRLYEVPPKSSKLDGGSEWCTAVTLPFVTPPSGRSPEGPSPVAYDNAVKK